MRVIGINEEYEIRRIVSKKLILNEKVVDYLYKRLTASKSHQLFSNKYVIATERNNRFVEITKNEIRKLLQNEQNMDKSLIIQYDETQRYYDMFRYSLQDFLYEDEDDAFDKPYFATHLDEFDFEDVISEERARLIRTDYH